MNSPGLRISSTSRPLDGRRGVRRLALLLAPLTALSTLAGTGTASGTPAPVDSAATTVTLITGDVVTYRERHGEPTFTVDAAPRDDGVTFLSRGDKERFYVYPSDVADDVRAGRLDEELFNIPGLIRQGLDDASTQGELPVIVTFEQDRDVEQLARDADALPATSDPIAVEGVNAAGVTVDLSDAERFRTALLDDSTSRTSGLGGGVDSVVLDQVLHLDLDESVRQIGAPEAWDAGYTGAGVTVAVLDTGVDASHPDLAGKVKAAADFTGDGDTGDPHGHGTHVASTIAGTGAASNGRYAGVAPDAELISGKVCDAAGDCPSTAIMAGMEWASENADVVNMSLGTDLPTDGTDILSQLLNELSAETDTLFVTAAGNAGPAAGTVSAPGAADAAVAVGAVDKSDQLAGFSARGSRIGDFAVKPDLTAPGVGIVAARAAGIEPAEPVGDSYMSASGTSMAAPHVAGAAALLAQARPELSAVELKDALVSTAADGGYRTSEQGTGRVDVARAVDQGVYATASIGFDDVSDADRPITRRIVYTNHTAKDVRLALDAQLSDETGRPVDTGFSLSARNVRVPAGGRVTVTATVKPKAFAGAGAIEGVVTATRGAKVTLRTGVGFGSGSMDEPDGFSPSSTSWTSRSHGWVLGWTPCQDTLCADVRRTTDGGRSWSAKAAPRIHPSEYGDQTRIYFAEHARRTIGIITDGRQLFVSYDGARSWQQWSLGVDQIGAIDSTDKNVYLFGLTATGSDVMTELFTAPIKKPHWTRIREVRDTRSGSLPTMVTDVSAKDRTIQASTSSFGTGDRVWTAPKEKRFDSANPCNDFSATRVGVAGRDRQYVLCTSDPRQGYSTKELMATSNGKSYASIGLAPDLGVTTDFAVADKARLAVGATGGDMGVVLMSFDGGQTWEATFAEPNTGPVLDLAFQDSSHGTLVTGYPALGTSKVYRTLNGGRTWIRVGFSG